VSAALGWQLGMLARRSVVRTLRQPAQIVVGLAFPLLLLALNTGGLQGLTHLPRFPTDSYVTFALAAIFIQGGMFAMIVAGTDLATDIQTGFFNRLAMTPLRGGAIVAGELAGVVLLGLVQAAAFIGVGLAAGAGVAAGVGGALLVILLSLTISLAFGIVGAAGALRTGSAEAVQGFFPLFFVLLFLSSANLPRNLIGIDWFREVATYNPVSYLIEGLRSLLITGWDGRALALAFGCTLAIGGLAALAVSAGLRQRMERT
jgi:ABC-2 type transport system permease protein